MGWETKILNRVTHHLKGKPTIEIYCHMIETSARYDLRFQTIITTEIIYNWPGRLPICSQFDCVNKITIRCNIERYLRLERMGYIRVAFGRQNYAQAFIIFTTATNSMIYVLEKGADIVVCGYVRYLLQFITLVLVENVVWLPPAAIFEFHMMTSSNGNISALLAPCAGNSPVTDEFPSQRLVTRSFDVFFDLRLNKQLSKQSWGWWFETPSCSLWRHCYELPLVPPMSSLTVWFPTFFPFFVQTLRHVKLSNTSPIVC